MQVLYVEKLDFLSELACWYEKENQLDQECLKLKKGIDCCFRDLSCYPFPFRLEQQTPILKLHLNLLPRRFVQPPDEHLKKKIHVLSP